MNVETILQNAKRLVQESGLNYRQVGVRMGYPSKSARQSVSQFLNSENPSLAKFLRFAEAMEVEPKELLNDI